MLEKVLRMSPKARTGTSGRTLVILARQCIRAFLTVAYCSEQREPLWLSDAYPIISAGTSARNGSSSPCDLLPF